MLDCTTRWPSNSTRVRVMPRLRRLTVSMPVMARHDVARAAAIVGRRRSADRRKFADRVADAGLGVALELLGRRPR